MSNATTLGHNNPPSEFEMHESEIIKYYDEAKIWLDGDEINTPELAKAVTELKKLCKNSRIAAEKSRKGDKEPHLEAGRRVDESYKPMLEMAKLAENTCSQALLPWEKEQDRLNAIKAEEAREEAERLRLEELAAHQAKDITNLEDVEMAEELTDASKKADKTAKRAEKAVSASRVKITYSAVIEDAHAAAGHYWKSDAQSFIDVVQTLATRDVRSGKRDIPGIKIIERKWVL